MVSAVYAWMLLWLASLGYSSIRERNDAKETNSFFPTEAHSDEIVKLGADHATQSNAIFGLVEIRQPASFDFMERYNNMTTLQLDFWKSIFTDAQLYVFDLKHAAQLAEPVSLLQCHSRLLRGLVVELEPGQAERLWGKIQLQQHWRGLAIPCVALRIPPQYAFLCVTGVFSSIVLAAGLADGGI